MSRSRGAERAACQALRDAGFGASAAASAKAAASKRQPRQATRPRSAAAREVEPAVRADASCAPQRGDGDHQRDGGGIGSRSEPEAARARERGRPRRERRAVADDAGGARAGIGRTGAGSAARGASAARSRAGGASGAASIERATIAPKTAASISELLASRLAPCRPVAGRFAARPKAGERAAALGVHGDPAHVIVLRRPNRDRLARRIDAGRAAGRGDDREARREPRPDRRARVEEDAPALRALAAMARATTSRGASSAPGTSGHEPLAGIVDQDRAFAAHRLADQRHRIGARRRARSGGTARTPCRRVSRRRAPQARGPGRSCRAGWCCRS